MKDLVMAEIVVEATICIFVAIGSIGFTFLSFRLFWHLGSFFKKKAKQN